MHEGEGKRRIVEGIDLQHCDLVQYGQDQEIVAVKTVGVGVGVGVGAGVGVGVLHDVYPFQPSKNKI